jgi:RimJ/RimL family protein N-acetyltransferase
MILKGKEIVLRPVVKDDYRLIFKWFNDKEIIDNIIGFRLNFSMGEALDWCERASRVDDKNIKWIIETIGEKPEPIGFTGLYNIDFINKNAESAIVIGEKSFWGKGIGNKSLTLVCNLAFKYFNLELVYAFILSSNKASLNLYEKIGFKEEGILRKRVYRNRKWHDVISLSIGKEEFNI